MSDVICSLEGCSDNYRVLTPRKYGKPLCSKHSQRFYKYGDPLGGSDWGMPSRGHKVCKFEGCGRWHKARGYCCTHYRQLLDGIELRPIGVAPPIRICEYCNEVAIKRGMCNTHYGRWQRGTPIDRPISPWKGPRLDWGSESIRNCAITGAHARITRAFGAAKQYPCIECGGDAHQWAYDGTDPTQKLGHHSRSSTMMWYSVYPEFYMPMCQRCHKTRDVALAAAELNEYRQMKLQGAA